MSEEVWTIIDVVNWTTDFLKKKGVDSPRLNIELMICEALNLDRIDIYTQFDKPLKKQELALLRNMILKRADREPLQYIVGKTNFLGYEILVNDSVMIPRPETELLTDTVIKDTANEYKKIDILDIGCGSGCVSLVLAKKFPNSKVLAVDNSYFALMTAKNNASNLAVKNAQFNSCNALEEIPTNKKFDIIVSNPPYVPKEEYEELSDEIVKYEPKDAVTDDKDGLTFYKRFAEIFPELLKEKGKFYLEIGEGQDEELKDLFESVGYSVVFVEDFNKKKRIIIGFLQN